MKAYRFPICWLMAVVALVALNLKVIREYPVGTTINGFMLIGCLPMANILAVGLLFDFRRRTSRPFLLGFELFGATALASYAIVANHFRFEYLHSVILPLSVFFGQPLSRTRSLVFYFIATVMLGVPQLVIALAGGLLFRKFRIAERSDQELRSLRFKMATPLIVAISRYGVRGHKNIN